MGYRPRSPSFVRTGTSLEEREVGEVDFTRTLRFGTFLETRNALPFILSPNRYSKNLLLLTSPYKGEVNYEGQIQHA